MTNAKTRGYFFPALLIRLVGAVLLGILYQFYYGGGDTFNYWEHGSVWIYKAFQEDFITGLSLLMERGGSWNAATFPYTVNIWYYRDPASYAVVKTAALFDLVTFRTYSATALLFACFSFSGLWAMYTALETQYPQNAKRLAIAIMFVPSVIFWGSGILKDTVTLGALGWMTWAFLQMINHKRYDFISICTLLITLWMIFRIKQYILICFLPMVVIWLFFKVAKQIRNKILKVLLVPFLLLFFSVFAFITLEQVAGDSGKYQLDGIAETVRITAYDIRYGWGARTGGEGGYDIGLPDGTWGNMLGLAPKAINVSLFRPYFWEVKNPLMLLSAFESLAILLLTIFMIVRGGFKQKLKDPFLIFCLAFSLLFAFAVGVSTFNFGTLMRYKIPLMPFYLVFLLIDLRKNARY